MPNNERMELPASEPDNIPIIPADFIYEALRAEAKRAGGRELQQEIISTALTSSFGVLCDRAMSELEEQKSGSIIRVWDRATEMHDKYVKAQDRKRRSSEHRKEIYRKILSISASSYMGVGLLPGAVAADFTPKPDSADLRDID